MGEGGGSGYYFSSSLPFDRFRGGRTSFNGCSRMESRRGVRILQLQQESLAGFERKRREKERRTRAHDREIPDGARGIDSNPRIGSLLRMGVALAAEIKLLKIVSRICDQIHARTIHPPTRGGERRGGHRAEINQFYFLARRAPRVLLAFDKSGVVDQR